MIETEDEEVRRFIAEWTDEREFIIAHTSGSTGTPKEIRLPKSDMRVSARATNRRFGIRETDTLMLPLSVSYIAGKMMIVRALEAGCRLVTETPSNSPWKEDCGDVALMAVVPSQVSSLFDNPIAHRRLKNLIVGGAPMSADLEERLKKMPWHTFATYGMTETCSHVALREMGSEHYRAMPGITFGTDERGCLVINAPEYSFKQLTTNDVVELKDEQTFRWLGRADNVINSGGIKIHPEELEKQLAPHLPYPFYFDGIPHAEWGTALRLTIETDNAEEESLMELCRQILPKKMIPKEIRILKRIPRTTSGKIIRG